MELVEILAKKNDKFNKLKIKKVEYDRKKGKCHVFIVYPDDWKCVKESEKQDIHESIIKFIDLPNVEVELFFNKSYIDSSVAYFEIIECLKDMPQWNEEILKEDVESLCEDELNKIIISVSQSIFKSPFTLKIKNKLLEHFSNNFCQQIDIEIKIGKKDFNLDKDVMEKEYKAYALSKMQSFNDKGTPIYDKFEFLGNIVGEVKGTEAQRLNTELTEQDNVVVVGKLDQFTKRSFTKQDKEGNEVEKFYYSLTLKDNYGSVNGVIFPKQEMLETYDALILGMELAVSGTVQINVSNGAKNIKINAIARAILPEYKQEHKEYLNEFNRYFVCEPTPYVEEQQLSLLNFEQVEICKEFLEKNDVVVFDLETTGLSAVNCFIIEIGAVKIQKGKITEKFQILIKPPVKISDEITNITNITNDMVESAPSYELALADFYRFCKGCTLSAYNISFDYSFIKKYGELIGFNFNHPQLDTMALARKKLKGLSNYQLKTVVKALDINLVGAHRALNDALATAKVFIKLID